MKICFLNPFGSPDYDPIIEEVLGAAMRPEAVLEVRHLDIRPENMDYFAAKYLVETGIMKAAVRAEQDGFDAFVIGCCYDPALTQCRELVDIPVVGPLEATISLTRPFGHRWALVTDHPKAATEISDRIRVYGQEVNCRGVSSVGRFIDDMIRDTASVAADAYTTSSQVMATTGAETVIVGCTIVAACYEKHAKDDPELQGISLIDPNIAAVKQAELLADLNGQGQYRIARTGTTSRSPHTTRIKHVSCTRSSPPERGLAAGDLGLPRPSAQTAQLSRSIRSSFAARRAPRWVMEPTSQRRRGR